MDLTNPFSEIELAPGDPILGLTEAFNKDPNPQKVNLTVGIYQNAEAKVPILESTKRAAAHVLETEISKAYLPIDGLKEFNQATQQLIFGKESKALEEQRIVTIQTVAGSGALKVGADFIKKHLPTSEIALSNPSWENHRAIFEAAGIKCSSYRYYDKQTNGLDRAGMLSDLKLLPQGSVVLLHVCCHNPTGVDLSQQDWPEVLEIVKDRKLVPFFDLAYQGFSHDLDRDASPVRLFAEAGICCLVASSCSKNFSLYRERVGSLSVVTANSSQATKVLSQLKRIVRTIYSSPPSFGAQIVATILQSSELKALWLTELNSMAGRIKEMRTKFVQSLKDLNSAKDFSFVLNQAGMFSYSGITKEQAEILRNKYAIYLLDSGRICLAALNQKNLPYVAQNIVSVL